MAFPFYPLVIGAIFMSIHSRVVSIPKHALYKPRYRKVLMAYQSQVLALFSQVGLPINILVVHGTVRIDIYKRGKVGTVRRIPPEAKGTCDAQRRMIPDYKPRSLLLPLGHHALMLPTTATF